MTTPVTPAPPGATTFPVAELERRFVAFAVDRLVGWCLALGAGAIAWALGGDWQVVLGTVLGTLVVGWLVSSIVLGVSGTSLGMSLLGLRVVHHGTGTPVGVGPALGRSLVLGLLGLPTFGLGVAALAWTAVEDRGRRRRGWHDHLTSTVVVDVRPAPEVAPEGAEAGPRHIVNLTALRLVPAPAVEEPAVPARGHSGEHSTRREPLIPAPTPASQPRASNPSATPVPHLPQASAAPAPQATPGAPPAGPPPAGPPPSYDLTPDDPGRTQVRRRREPQPEPQPVPHAGPGWRVRFDDGSSFVVEGMALVGRRPEPRSGEQVRHLVPLTSADMSVSKTHAQFGPTPDGTLAVMDRGSTNGTTLVRQGVSRQLAAGKPATLLDGDTVVFGDRTMAVVRDA